jgi:hypothetical protein
MSWTYTSTSRPFGVREVETGEVEQGMLMKSATRSDQHHSHQLPSLLAFRAEKEFGRRMDNEPICPWELVGEELAKGAGRLGVIARSESVLILPERLRSIRERFIERFDLSFDYTTQQSNIY